ncbi:MULTISPECIES: penicillin-binding protein PBP1B [Streptococcus]|jgi:penicillin-binding protein 1B|uniref:Penicillin-binding protein 1F n=1 Tax=Streptococcus mitis TaxID=28037 RepID=A0A428DMW1_STRMT|nr:MULTISPECIES: penicillin-binding protein PBP1B [Streptococcus]MBZ2105150.1 penicillin-binding protein PBP1B [Streptococcus mitis]MBZ2108675.1 penicillin-binding protein PBP1B [Streptococcus mitis]MDU1739749.1 penicillin-binding protein PBP1B [Streptococcus mitis]RRD32773.1 penicillin-binding protein [Streptococcus sp. OH4692_COT-348]RSI96630.1 Penicillin-binding protein 1F [Streptococcus mitis]
MKERISELKTKMLNIFQQGALRKKQEGKKHKKSSSVNQPIGVGSIFAKILRGIKVTFNTLFILGFIGGLFGAGLAIGYGVALFDKAKVPQAEELLKQVKNIASISEITYSDGSTIASIEGDLLRTSVGSDAISDNLKRAIIATEDEHFNEHHGVVPKAVIRATLGTFVGLGSSSGGSTLTQQVIKQQVVGDAPTLARKATEIVDALALERVMGKDEILTAYLNIAPFGRNNKGQNIAGAQQAAEGIFGVEASKLSVPQAAFIAGLPQSPISYSPYESDGSMKSDEDMALGIKRAKDVLYNMYRTGALSQEDYQQYKDYDFKKDFLPSGSVSTASRGYLYFATLAEAVDRMYDYLIQQDNVSSQELKNESIQKAYRDLATKEIENGGYKVTTTINKNIHTAMQNAVASYGRLVDDSTGQPEVGNVLMDNKTGAILGFVGGRNYQENQNNHAIDTKRSPASTTKPLLAYGIAIDQGLMGSASILSNYPTNFSNGNPIMYVNSPGTAMMTLGEALNYSWNIPAYWTYRTLREKGVDVKGYMEKMGYEIPEYGIESLPMGGGIEVTVAQHTNGYQTIANNGVYQQKHMIAKIESPDGRVVYEYKSQPVQVYSKATATIMQSLLRDVISSRITSSFQSDLSSINPSLASADWIGKTGTTNEDENMWLMLSTPRLTLGGWLGHDDNRPLAKGAGHYRNANYMAHLVNAIQQAEPGIWGNERFNLDSSVTKSQVLKSTGQKPGKVSINGKEVDISGSTVTSYWATKEGAPVTTYRFAIGGSDADYQNAWKSILGNLPSLTLPNVNNNSGTRSSTGTSRSNR